MKHKLIVTLIAVSAVVTTIGAVTLAHGRGGRRDFGERGTKHDKIGRMMKHLDLTADQQGKIGKLREAMLKKADPLEKKLRDIKQKERAAWRAEKPDKKKVIGLHREMLKVRGSLDELHIGHRFDMYDLLTKEQREKLREKRGKKFGKGRDKKFEKGLSRGHKRRGGRFEKGFDRGKDAS